MCIVDGGFNELVSWETCSKSCETGISIRKLTCTKPSPKYGGKPCLGDNYREKECNTEPCPSKNNFGKSMCIKYIGLYPNQYTTERWPLCSSFLT